MLPKKIRYSLFERLSVQTMRYVDAVPSDRTSGLLAEIYRQVAEDFFINGSLTSHSAVPELMAGVWMGGREAIIQPDKLDQKTKEAMAATLSRVNDCPYCGDMLVSLVHSAGDKAAANGIFTGREQIPDKRLQQRLQWVSQVAAPDGRLMPEPPFSEEQLPEAIATLVAMGHINRFSHVVMDGSPVPFGLSRAKYGALSVFAVELKDVVRQPLQPGRALGLLPPAELPADMSWAAGNPRIAAAMARWAAAIEQHAKAAVPKGVQSLLAEQVNRWQGESMPMSRAWLEERVGKLRPAERDIARLMLVVALSPWQFSDELIQPLLGGEGDKRRLVKILNVAAFAGARRLGERLGRFYLAARNTVATP